MSLEGEVGMWRLMKSWCMKARVLGGLALLAVPRRSVYSADEYHRLEREYRTLEDRKTELGREVLVLQVENEKLNDRLNNSALLHFWGRSEVERLAMLAEECGEVVQVAGKILRHGYQAYNPYDERQRTNRVLLERELGHVYAIVTLMRRSGDIRIADVREWEKKHLRRLPEWTHYQEYDAAPAKASAAD